jgi:hypothetical protein
MTSQIHVVSYIRCGMILERREKSTTHLKYILRQNGGDLVGADGT